MAEWSKVPGFPLGDLRLEPRFGYFLSFRLALFSRFQFYHLQRPSSCRARSPLVKNYACLRIDFYVTCLRLFYWIMQNDASLWHAKEAHPCDTQTPFDTWSWLSRVEYKDRAAFVWSGLVCTGWWSARELPARQISASNSNCFDLNLRPTPKTMMLSTVKIPENNGLRLVPPLGNAHA